MLDPNFRRMYYVRYADDFIIGVRGSHNDTNHILVNLSNILEKKYKLVLHAKKIRHMSSEGVQFLGVRIGPSQLDDRPVRLYSSPKGQGVKRRIVPRLPLVCDIIPLFKKLKERGFVKYSRSLNRHVGIAYGRMQNLDMVDIIRFFNSVFKGIWNYYSVVDNSSHLNSV